MDLLKHKPKLVVFDLDYTLWPLWCDTHVQPPITKAGERVYDGKGREVRLYSEAAEVLKNYSSQTELVMGVASRTGAIEIANRLMKLLELDQYFKFKEIFPGRKTEHFKRLKELSGIQYSDMLFFDDEERNINDVSRLGVCCVLVYDGICHSLVKNANQTFSETYGKRFAKDKQSISA